MRRVAAKTHVLSIHLAEVNAKRGPAAASRPENLEVTYRTQASGRARIDDGHLVVAIRFAFRTRPKVFDVVATYEVDYVLDGEVEVEDADLFAEVNGTFNCWPYWRELVQSLTTRMEIEAPILPPLRIV